MANLLQPRKWRAKALLVKSEPTYGVDSIPTGAVNWIEARNVSLSPMDTDKVDRNIVMDTLGNSGSIIVSQWAKLSFDVAFAPSGTLGTAPKWGALIMATGFAETTSAGVSVTYNLISSNYGSLCAYMYIGDVLHKLLGMRGELKVKQNAKGTPMMTVSYDAVYVTPADGAMPAVTKTGWAIEEAVNSKNTSPVSVNAVNLAYSELEWGLGNKLSRVDLPGPQYGIEINDRSPSASIKVLAPALSVFNPFAIAESGITVPISVTHGSVAGKKIKTDLKARIIGVDYDSIEDLTAYKLTLSPVPVVGNDEITLTCL